MTLVFSPEQKIKYSGNYSFSFSLECKKEESSVLALVAVANRQGMPIPTKCTWKRLINGREYVIPLTTK